VSELQEESTRSTRDIILDEALHCFAERGYEGTSLNDIAAEVGIRRPSLLHHFASKEALYGDVFERLLSEWLERLDIAIASPQAGWAKAELVLRAGSATLRPLFDKACAYFDDQMDQGTFRRHDSRHLLITGYGAILTYFSDAPFIDGLLDEEALTPNNIRDHCEHVVGFFRAALLTD
jgi:AcrR family transcriptional regulator